MAFFLRIFIIGFFVGTFLVAMMEKKHECNFPIERISGIVSDFPEPFDTFVQFPIRVGEYRLLIRAPFFPQFSYGDLLEVEGKISSLPSASKNYYLSSGICAQVKYPRLKFIESAKGDFFKNFLFKFRKIFTEEIEEIFHEPQSTLAASLLLGRHGKSEHDEDFRKAGLSHITALSGFNITILIFFIAACTRFFPHRLRFLLSVLVILLFTMLAGAQASIVRAAIMGLLWISSRRIGRSSSPLHALLIAGFLMVLFEPLIVAYDVGFELSFAATLGLILFGNFFKKLLAKTFFPGMVQEIFASTIAAQVLATPIILFRFGAFNPLTLFSNLLVVSFIPILMGLVFVSATLHFVTETGGLMIAWYADFLLRWMFWIAKLFSPFSIFWENLRFPH